jgi:hypothetical protein
MDYLHHVVDDNIRLGNHISSMEFDPALQQATTGRQHTMELHQLQVTYQAGQDRLLCRASFSRERPDNPTAQSAGEGGNLSEIRAWLTRRMVRKLWPAIIQVLETQVTLTMPDAAHFKSDIVGMEHESSLDRMRTAGAFDTPFATDVRDFPFGETPLLVHHVDFTMDAGQPIRVTLRPETGPGFELKMASAMFHAFCELMRDAVRQAEWDVELALPGMAAPRGMALN